jgi:hypothetical protein
MIFMETQRDKGVELRRVRFSVSRKIGFAPTACPRHVRDDCGEIHRSHAIRRSDKEQWCFFAQQFKAFYLIHQQIGIEEVGFASPYLHLLSFFY